MPRAKVLDAKPKGRMSAYAFFVQYSRLEHKEKFPEESVVFSEFSKKCADRWKLMDEKDKQPFFESADKDKTRYYSEMSDYQGPKGVRGRRKRQKKDPNAPKRALSAFFWFCNDERPKARSLYPNMGIGEMAKELAGRWGRLTQDDKLRYDEMAKKDKARYAEEMKVFKASPPPPPPQTYKQEMPQVVPPQPNNSMMNYASNSNFASNSNYQAHMNYGVNPNYAAAAAAANPNYMAYQNYAAANANYMTHANYAAALAPNSSYGQQQDNESDEEDEEDGTE